jgi:hypothetical protein
VNLLQDTEVMITQPMPPNGSLFANFAKQTKPGEKAKRLRSAISRAWKKIQPVSLSVAGLGSLVTAAFQYSTLVGFIVAGLSFFVLEWRVNG